MKTDIHPDYAAVLGALLVREHLHHPLDQARDHPRALQRVPPVLHRQAEAGGLRRSGRALPAPLRNRRSEEEARNPFGGLTYPADPLRPDRPLLPSGPRPIAEPAIDGVTGG